MSTEPIQTAYAVSPDSGVHWTAEGAWEVAEGVHRIPLPLPMDGLKAVNVYALSGDDGLVLVDGGWAIPEAREVLERSLSQLGAGFGDIRHFLVTHVHRDHYTLARVLGREFGAHVSMGLDDKPTLDLFASGFEGFVGNPFWQELVLAGARDVADQWNKRRGDAGALDPRRWDYPDTWLVGDHTIELDRRRLEAVHTPGHTPGHFVFADLVEGLLFAGDHVLPTITPSIGFNMPVAATPLGDFMASLTKVRALPDLRVLPAHGPVAPSSHARVDELLAHHEERLQDCAFAIADRALTASEVAARLGWTRHKRAYAALDIYNRGMAAMETKAHLELMVARGSATRSAGLDGSYIYLQSQGD